MKMNLSKLMEIMEDKGAWHTGVHGITKSWTRLRNLSGVTGLTSCPVSFIRDLIMS